MSELDRPATRGSSQRVAHWWMCSLTILLTASAGCGGEEQPRGNPADDPAAEQSSPAANSQGGIASKPPGNPEKAARKEELPEDQAADTASEAASKPLDGTPAGEPTNSNAAVAAMSQAARAKALEKLGAKVELDRFEEITLVDFQGTEEITNADLALLSGLDRLHTLNLELTSITNEGLKHLASLERLETLKLGGSEKLSGAALAQLKDLRTLAELDLDSLKIDDASLQHLADLSSLKHLNLSRTPIDGSGLAHLVDLPRLKELFLHGSNVTDESLQHVAAMTRLEMLCVDETPVTEAGLESIGRLYELEMLHVATNSPISPAALQEHLRELERLQALKISGAELTEEQLANLQKAFPNVKIEIAP
ncbi:MAG: hypothetical protein KY476_26745 [Planctomycetes bacterium]|nr:hypothetical protein [Planctomycetota bacterium]